MPRAGRRTSRPVASIPRRARTRPPPSQPRTPSPARTKAPIRGPGVEGEAARVPGLSAAGSAGAPGCARGGQRDRPPERAPTARWNRLVGGGQVVGVWLPEVARRAGRTADRAPRRERDCGIFGAGQAGELAVGLVDMRCRAAGTSGRDLVRADRSERVAMGQCVIAIGERAATFRDCTDRDRADNRGHERDDHDDPLHARTIREAR